MSNITATYNTVDNTCVIDTSNAAEILNFLGIIFTGDTPRIDFSTNVRFGYSMVDTETDTTVRSQDYVDGGFPPPSVVYTSANNGTVFNSDRYELSPGTEYTFNIWFEIGSEIREFNNTFTTPKPAQPFPSWTWGNRKWNSPVPKPAPTIDPTHNIEIPLTWNETAQAWEEFPLYPEPPVVDPRSV
jgi:hypothetical protein